MISSEDLLLIDQIVELQKHLIEVGTSKGLDHPETLKCSEEMDRLLNKFRSIYWESPNYFQQLLEIIKSKVH
ncbi:aspartyl-phosphate phosphatase Spo0E family protein [Lysinibacillus yapensis]|uniref:Aspartyl-phosphate phosphatase Spo0E family protein n=2 Tax=Ureibacillus yapensis TaxID=2304605 RepID=A0A396SEJ4_9BACL|nr:aspartyl-phosphate phosphatase Spo0E family protein [Lysinibacillus yapensis]